ncbi:hypothetical protein O1L55_20565 [Streptomyces albulus]|nr:hypothetical protein [Streptomyces noursei]
MTIRILPAVGDRTPPGPWPHCSARCRTPNRRPPSPTGPRCSTRWPGPPDRPARRRRPHRRRRRPGGRPGAPEVVLVHEGIGPGPALELIREVALRFPAVGVVLITADAGPALFSAAMDAGARGIVALPLGYDELVARVQAAAQWAAGVRVHLGATWTRCPHRPAPWSPSPVPRAASAPP